MNRLDTTILVVGGVVGLTAFAAARDLPPGPRVRGLWLRVDPYVGCYVRRSPATFAYVGILFVTTWVVAGTRPAVSTALLRSQSTNLDNLRTHPVDVLFRSAFWTGGTSVLPVIATLAVVLAPVEVWLGTARLILVFALGHVGATLVTALAISEGFFSSGGQAGVERAIDVGISYGTVCVAAVLLHRFPRALGIPLAAALLLAFGLLAFAFGKTFTDFGHFAALLIGFAVYPLVRGGAVDERALSPLYRPWLARRV
jgi:hypothetical protein